MYVINYVQLTFALLTSSLIAVGSLINYFEKYLPAFISQIFRYGKFAYNGKNSYLIKPIQVPKSWFRHFYFVSSNLTLFTLYLVVNAYVFEVGPPLWVIRLLDCCCGSLRNAAASRINVLLAVFLLTLQCLRRLYDTNYVSVFGKNSRMDLSHYIIGLTHYAGAVLAILCEAPLFAESSQEKEFFYDIDFVAVFATFLFLWAWINQYKATVILGNLRRNEKGEIITDNHKIPYGDWFDYVSSPHLLAEILMYAALTLLLKENKTWWFVFGWVISNQVETALLSHWWYQSKFEDFPKSRKALVPFIY